MLPLLQDSLIEEKKWFTEEEFLDIVAVTQGLPGVIAINMATYVGYKKGGFLGSIIATIGVVLPSFVLILIMANGITALGGNKAVMGAMAGLRATALGLIIWAVIRMAPTAIKNKWSVISALAAFIMITVLNINTAWVILLFLLLGIASALVGGKKAAAAMAEADTEVISKAEAGGDPIDGNESKIGLHEDEIEAGLRAEEGGEQE